MPFPTDDSLASLPKVELHVHLEGTVTATIASDLAREHGDNPDEVLLLENGAYPAAYRDFLHFVDTFVATSRQIRTPDDLTTVAAAFARQQQAQNVKYCETTVTALGFIDNGFSPADLWQALRDGFATADVEIGLIIDVVRDLGPERAEATIRLVADADAPVVAFGLTGVEGSVPEREFVTLRHAADRLGIGLVVHAGETGTADNVRAALDDLGADRIGHGVAAVHDPALVARLAAEQVIVEVCPSSNVTLGVAESLDAHPLPRFVAAGIAVTINSDDPPFFATTLTDELRHAARMANFTTSDLADLQRRAINASFAPARVKDATRRALDDWSARHD